jgi:putative flavoprotein involved in K+ transport
MPKTDTIVIGAGQAGLSLSHHLTRAGRSHVVLDRGRIGERWTERWDALSLLTPNWLNRLDGGEAHEDPDGFLSRDGFISYLRRYARASGGHVAEYIGVLSVERARDGFHVATEAGGWQARNVVVATGDQSAPRLPRVASTVPRWLRSIHANRYRNPEALRAGGVLVVGAGPSGQQIAADLRRAGRDVVLAVGNHARSPRTYRGRDIWWWLREAGDLDRTAEEVAAATAAGARPKTLALSGANGGEQLDLGVLQEFGVELAGHVEGFDGTHVRFADDLHETAAAADLAMRVALDEIDQHIERTNPRWSHERDRLPELDLGPGPATLDLAARGIATVIWATGFRREYPWLHVPEALDEAGEVVHRHGVTEVPGLYVLGLKFQRRKISHAIGGVGADAAFLAEHIVQGLEAPAVERSRPGVVVRLRPAISPC